MRNLLTIIVPFKGNKKKIDQFFYNHNDLIEQKNFFKFMIIDSSSKISNLPKSKEVDYYYRPNLSLYSAINYGIKECRTKFYLVIGIDDKIYKEILLIKNILINNENPILTFPVKNCLNFLPFLKIRINHRNYVYQHSVSTVFRKSLHKTIGYYPSKFKLSADAFLILKAVKQNIKISKYSNPIIGEYDISGLSSTKTSLALYELAIICFQLGYIKSSIYYFLTSIYKKSLKFLKV